MAKWTRPLHSHDEHVKIARPVGPRTLKVTESVDRLQVAWMRDDDERREYIKSLKRRMCRYLADALMEELQFFSDKFFLDQGEVISLEVTLNDRGQYDNWLKHERAEGHVEGYYAGTYDTIGAMNERRTSEHRR